MGKRGIWGKHPFLNLTEGKNFEKLKVPTIGAGILKKAPIIGAIFPQNLPIRAAHPKIPKILEYPPAGLPIP